MGATLEEVWKGGGSGALSPLTQVRVWALRVAGEELRRRGDHREGLLALTGLAVSRGRRGRLLRVPLPRQQKSPGRSEDLCRSMVESVSLCVCLSFGRSAGLSAA